MRKLTLGLVVFFIFPTLSFATWQIADPLHGTSPKRSLTDQLHDTDYPYSYQDTIKVRVFKGGLRDNVERLAYEHGWRVEWQAPEHNYVMTNDKIAGPTFPIVMDRLLDNYPLMATHDCYYQITRVVSKTYYWRQSAPISVSYTK